MRFRSSSCFISVNTSRPSFFGKFKSNKIKSGFGFFANSPFFRRNAIAFTPSSTTWSVLMILFSFNASRINRISPGLSSTRRISACLDSFELVEQPLVFFSFLFHIFWNREEKCRAFPWFGFNPNSPAVSFDNLFTYR